jgi:hypothetical protein
MIFGPEKHQVEIMEGLAKDNPAIPVLKALKVILATSSRWGRLPVLHIIGPVNAKI